MKISVQLSLLPGDSASDKAKWGKDHGIEGIELLGFDGIDNLPIGLEDAFKLANLIEELLKRGHTAEDIEKICSKNLFRVWNEVIKVSEQHNVM